MSQSGYGCLCERDNLLLRVAKADAPQGGRLDAHSQEDQRLPMQGFCEEGFARE
jgi:hypothetical protein